MSLVITDGSLTVTYLDATDGFTRTAGRYWTRLPMKGERYGVIRIKAPATAGKKRNYEDFDHRDLGPFLVWYVSSTIQNIWDAYEADGIIMFNSPLTLTVPNYKAFPSLVCNLEDFDPVHYPQASGPSLFRMPVLVGLKQDRDA